MLTIDKIREITTEIGQRYGVKRIELFGSYARGDANDDSDVDILIDRGEIRDFMTLSGFQLDLAEALQKNVDIVTTAGIKDSFYRLIEHDKVLLYGA